MNAPGAQLATRANHGATARCACGGVILETKGAPILSVACYCDDCQEGSRRIAALPNARPVLDPDGGTAFLLYRKDRVTRVKGAELLKGYKVRETSPTSRVVASCCNSAMYLDFEKGHWLSLYRAGFAGDAPPVQMRIQTKFRPGSGEFPDDVPSYKAFPFAFIAKLLGARLAMLLGT